MVNHGLGIQFNRTSVLRKVDDAIHRINRYLVVDKTNHEIRWIVIYPVDIALSTF